MQRQDGPQGKTAHDHHFARLEQLGVGILDRRVPVLPAGRAQVLDAPAMSGKLRTADRVASPCQPNRDEPHLDRRAAEAVDQQKADRPAAKPLAVVWNAHDSSCCSCWWKPRRAYAQADLRTFLTSQLAMMA